MFKTADEIRREVKRSNEIRAMKERCGAEKVALAITSLREMAMEAGTTHGISAFFILDNIKDEEKEIILNELAKDGYRIIWNPFVSEYEISIP